MHRVDTPTAGTDVNGAGKSGFIKGNAPMGVKSTRFSPEWCNAVQEEIAGVVEFTGVQLAKNNNGQLLPAITTLIAASSSPNYKAPVRAATTGAIVLNALQTVDGVMLAAGDRVLVKDQAAGADNGIYVAAAGAWARAADAVTGKIGSGALVPVREGSQAADSLWTLKTDGAIDIGTTAIAFSRIGGDGLPLGSVIMHSGATAPVGYLIANGAAVLRATYAALDTAMYVGDAANATAPAWYRCTDAGNPTGTRAVGGTYLVLPDYRGVVLRGLDLGRGIDPDGADRVINSYQVDDLKGHTHNIPGSTWDTTSGTSAMPGGGTSGFVINRLTSVAGSTETRGKNTAVLTCVKAFSAYTNQGLIDITELANDVASKVPWSAFTGGNQTLSVDGGYQRLPGGLIIQWGRYTGSSTTTLNITYPIAFPNRTLAVWGYDVDTTSAGFVTTGISPTAVGATLYASVSQGLMGWVAIGY